MNAKRIAIWAAATAAALLMTRFRGEAQSAHRVTIAGHAASVEVKMVGGQPYASLPELARSLGMLLVKRPDGYALVPAGGANQVQAKTTGKVGEELFTGDWRFKVLGVSETLEYTPQFSAVRTPVYPAGEGDKLIIVNCRLKNGHRVNELMDFETQFRAEDHTVIKDDQEHAYTLLGYDIHYDYYNWGQHVLPGAAVDFALIFSVPKTMQPSEVIYTISRYDDQLNPKMHTDVRIALAK